MKRFAIAFLVILLTAEIATAQYQPPALNSWKENSPDNHYTASTQIIPYAASPSNRDLDTCRLIIKPLKKYEGATLVSYDIPRLIAHIEWSPDSRFIVMTTVSAGGHSPWHFNSYVYSTKDKSLGYMDDTIGLVVRPEFAFISPHVVSMNVAGPNVDFENPKSTNIDLTKQTPKMKMLDGKVEGKIK